MSATELDAAEADPSDILQYALTLEHLEDYFYHWALDKFSADDFKNAGLPKWVRPT